MNPIKDKDVKKERFETPKVTNLEGKEVHLEEELEKISGGQMAQIDVDGHLCLGGG
jgi:hypothetical protein